MKLILVVLRPTVTTCTPVALNRLTILSKLLRGANGLRVMLTELSVIVVNLDVKAYIASSNACCRRKATPPMSLAADVS